MVSANLVSVNSKDEVLWDSEIKGYFDEDISVTSIVSGVFPREVVICFLSEDKVKTSVTDREEHNRTGKTCLCGVCNQASHLDTTKNEYSVCSQRHSSRWSPDGFHYKMRATCPQEEMVPRDTTII